MIKEQSTWFHKSGLMSLSCDVEDFSYLYLKYETINMIQN